MSNSTITILSAEKQFDGQNWASFQDIMISLARGKGYEGYLNGNIPRPTAAAPPGPSAAGFATSIYNPSISTAGGPTASLANSSTPSQAEWDLRDGQMGAMVYQNVKDPKAHGLSPTDTSREMWVALVGKFNRSSEVLKGLAFTKLRALKCKEGRHIRAHLDQLAKLRSEVGRVGGSVKDTEMNSIILQSLPLAEFRGSILMLQNFKFTYELVNELLSYWEISYGDEADAAQGNVVNTLAATTNSIVCSNCAVNGHTKERCWALGGGQEGQARGRWVAPAGKEPRQQLVEAAKAARAAKWSARVTATPTAAAAQTTQAATAVAPVTEAMTPTPVAVFTSPMAVYAMSISIPEDFDEGASRVCSSGADDNDLLRLGRGGAGAPVLNEIVSR
jgi:hypothetical protein